MSAAPQNWLIRIPPVFAGFTAEILKDLGAIPSKPLGADYQLIRISDPSLLRESPAAKFIQWNLPVQHAWPCSPPDITSFVEKAATALAAKFSARSPQAVIMGPLDPGSPNRYFKTLASNLRGRTLQLFAPETAGRRTEDQDALRSSLFCLVGREGLFAGMTSPREANGFHPGGTKYISQNSADTISRAGAKIAEALHLLPLHRPLPAPGSRWIELGASPGGMTSELLRRAYHVTAVDRAPLDARLASHPDLIFVQEDVSQFSPPSRGSFDAILSDLNGLPLQSLSHVIRVAERLSPRGVIIFTLKAAGAESYADFNSLFSEVKQSAAAAGLKLFATTHLTYNRKEFTLFFSRS